MAAAGYSVMATFQCLWRAIEREHCTHPSTETCYCCISAVAAAAAVSRYICRSELYEFDLAIDINIDIYPLKVGRVLAAQQQQHKARQHSYAGVLQLVRHSYGSSCMHP
jgi:hypothetical protein